MKAVTARKYRLTIGALQFAFGGVVAAGIFMIVWMQIVITAALNQFHADHPAGPPVDTSGTSYGALLTFGFMIYLGFGAWNRATEWTFAMTRMGPSGPPMIPELQFQAAFSLWGTLLFAACSVICLARLMIPFAEIPNRWSYVGDHPNGPQFNAWPVNPYDGMDYGAWGFWFVIFAIGTFVLLFGGLSGRTNATVE